MSLWLMIHGFSLAVDLRSVSHFYGPLQRTSHSTATASPRVRDLKEKESERLSKTEAIVFYNVVIRHIYHILSVTYTSLGTICEETT
jgi:hypothetical protein